LAEAVERIFFDLEQIRLVSEELQDPQTMRLKIGAIPTATMTALPPAISQFRKSFPQVRVEIFALPTEQIVQNVATGALDIGFAYSVPDHPAITAIDLDNTEIICAMRKDHPLARKTSITAHDLDGHPVISFHLGETISLTVNEAFRAAGTRCTPAMLVSHSFTACALAECGAGIAFVTPFLIASGIFRRLATRPFLPKVYLRPRILHARHRRPSREIREMIEEIRRAVGSQLGR
jgi:DNA-binding transcriptional LysR family regulator